MLRKVRKNYKRLVAFLLSAAMIITNVGGNAGTVFAAEGQEERESAIFMVDGQEILEAIQGLKDQAAFSKEDLEEMGLEASRKGVLKKYEKLLLPEEGKVYELALNINTELALEGTALQVFYNGKTKEVIFLYMNESGQSVDCYVNIDGYETKVVTVEANDANVTAGAQETTAGEETGGEPGNGSGGGSGSSGGGSGSTGGSGGSGNGGSGNGGGEASDGQGSEDGTSGEATEGSKEEASSADEESTPGEDADKASEEETKAEAPKEESKSDETGSSKEESKSEADEDGKEQPEKGTDGKDDKDEKESADSDKAENGGEEADKKETESAKPEGSGQDKGTSDKDDSQKTEEDSSKDDGKPGDADSGKDTDKAEGDDGKEDADKSDDKASDGKDSKEEDSADKSGDQGSADSKDDKEDKADQDSGDAKGDSADKADGSDSKEDSKDKADDGSSKGDSTDKANGGSDDTGSSKDEGKSSGSGDSGSDGAGADSSNDGGFGDRHDGNRLSLSMSRHQAGIVAIQLDEIQDEGEAEDEAEEETTTVEETEEETEEETTTAKETEEETEKETKVEAVKEETEGKAAEEETTEKAAEKETEAEATEKADQEETAKEESKAEETEKATETAAETKETEKESVKAEESKSQEETEKETTPAEAAAPEDTTADVSEDAEETETEAADTKESSETGAQEEGTTAPASESVTEEDASQAEGGNQGSADNAQGDSEELSDDWEIPGKLYDTVTIYETINARAYCVELKYVRKIVDSNGGEAIIEEIDAKFHADYLVNPEGAAKIKGTDSVKAGESLYFAVAPEDGYEVNAVLVNGDWLEPVVNPDELTDGAEFDWEGYPYVYQVEDVAEDLEVNIELAELVPVIPSRVYTGETSDAIISVDVPEGAFTEEVELRVAKIENEQQLEELTAQANGALKEEQAIAGVAAYDISFVSAESGEEIEPAAAVAVSINFKEAALPKEAEDKEVTEISVVHLPENEAAEVVATVENVNETKIEFQAESFSIFVVTYAATAAAATDENSFTTLQKAIDSVQDGGTLYLLRDVTENVTSTGKKYTLDMQGKTISSKEAGKTIFTINGGEVTFLNGTLDGENRTYNSTALDGKGIKAENAVLRLENCIVTGNIGRNKSYSGTYIDGGGIAAKGGSLTLVGCNIVGNSATGSGGGIHANGCTVEITGNSKISENTVVNSGTGSAGIYVINGTLNIDGAEISDNVMGADFEGNGSGIYAKNSSVNISNAVFSGNRMEIDNLTQAVALRGVELKKTSGYFGFSIKSNGEITAENCKFNDNGVITSKYSSTFSQGSVLYLNGTGKKTLSGCEFNNNIGTLNPYAYGPLNLGSGDAEINNCVFTGNSGFQSGGIFQNTTGETVLNGVTIAGNQGTDTGAVYQNKGGITASNTVIKENTGVKAGGVYMNQTSATMSFRLDSGALYNNKSKNTNGHDINIGGTRATVNILKASEMADGDYDFSEYIWSNLSSANIKEELTQSSSPIKTWSAVKTGAVAQIGDKLYDTLSAALREARSGDTVKIVTPYLPSGPMFTVDKNITIDMSGSVIYATDSASGSQGLSYSGATKGQVIKGGVFKIAKGAQLTLTGDGSVGSRIILAGGTLNLDGNVKIYPMSSSTSDCSETTAAVVGTTQNSKEPHGGIINVLGQMEQLRVFLKEGKVNVAESGEVGELKLNLTSANVQADIQGTVGTLNVKQSGGCVVQLDSRIDSLSLQHYFSSGNPVTSAGENFHADAMVLTPFWNQSNPTMDDQANPTVAVNDIIMISGAAGRKIQSNQVNWANVAWLNPNNSSTDPVKNSLTYNNINYKFLTAVTLDEKGNIVLHKTIPDNNYVFLSGKGKDTNSGLKPGEPVLTFAKAKQLLADNNLKTIYIIETVNVSKSNEPVWELGEGQMIQRYPTYKGALVNITSAGKLTLKNITIDGAHTESGSAAAEYPLIMNSGTLNIGDKAVLQNNINGYQNTLHEGGAVRNAGTLNMTGGEIKNNTAVSGGGVFNCGTFNMSGGTISGNKGNGKHRSSGTITSSGKQMDVYNAGGGIFIANRGTMSLSGGMISGNTAYMGGGISLGNNHNVYIGGKLTMTGGTIDSNESQKEGGGIFIQENGSVTVTGGNITNNKSHGGYFGGGGVYVNGGTGLAKNGVLKLENVKISHNEASGKGGGIAACPSANVNIYIDNGGLIKYNTGQGTDFDIYSTNIGYNKYSSRGIYLSRYMLGGASYEWTDVPGEAENELSIYSAAEKVSAKDEDLQVKITGNTADTKGGGIGANGDVIIGKVDPNAIEVSVSKEWKYTKDGEVLSGTLDANGKLVLGDELSAINSEIKSVTFQLQERKKGEGDDQWKNVTYGGTGKSVPNGEKWSTVSFINLRRTDAEGNEIEYRVIELTDDGFIVVDTTHKEDGNGNSSWTFTNMPAYSLKISKTVEDKHQKHPEGKEFEFEITLKKADEAHTPYSGKISAEKGVMGSEDDAAAVEAVDIDFADGKAVVHLGEDEYIHLKGLSGGMEYSVAEKEDNDYVTKVNGDLKNAAEGTIQIGMNKVEFLNTTKEPRGKLKLTKLVEGGDMARDWNFAIEFKKADGNPLDTTAKMYPFTYYEGAEDQEGTTVNRSITGGETKVTLHHGQSLVIGELPAGTLFTVKEAEANANNYTTILEGSIEAVSDSAEGKIAENEIAEVVFKNKLNTGSLEISKKVTVLGGDLTDRNKNDVFTFDVKLMKPEGTDGDLQNILHEFGVVEGIEGAAVPTDDAFVVAEPGKDSLKLKLTLKHGQKVILTNLPAGTTYTVNEKDAGESGYTAVKDSFTGVIEKEETAEAAFTNTVLTSGLMISKAVLGDSLTEANRNTEFTFEVELRDRDGSILTGRYPYTGSKEGTITSGETVTLKDGEWIAIQNLPEKAQYTVWEKITNTSGYTASVSGEGCSSVEGSGDKLIGGEGTLEGDGGSAVQFTNTVKVGSLEIKKTVSGIEPVEGRKFPFTLTVDNPAVNGEHGDVTFVNGVAEFELADNESVLVDRLPEGVHYTIEEGEHEGYTSNVPNNASGIIEGETLIPVSFINVVDAGELSVQKTVTGKAGEREKEFTFTIALTYEGNPLAGAYPYTGSTVAEGVSAPQSGNMTFDDKGEARITLKHGQKITVSGLPAGAEYKVTEAEANQDGYTTVVTDSVGIIVKDEEKTVKFVNDKPEIPEETTPEETTPEETTPEETTPEETTPEETSPSEEPTTPEETTPTEPTTPSESPENPTTPSRPSGGGGGGGRDRDRNPSVTPEPTPIPPEEVPLANIDPEDVPLAMMPSESPAEAMVIDDEGVPLFGLPRTGDRGVATGALIGMMLLSLMAACGIHVKKRKEEE